MADENEPQVDLLGDPWRELPDPRGRPKHRFSPQIAETVAVLRATGTTEADIALRIGISEPTLRKYYFRQLEQGPTVVRALLDEALLREAMKGKVSAINAARARLDEGQAAVPIAPEPKAEKLGKKAAADAEAKAAPGGSWGAILH